MFCRVLILIVNISLVSFFFGKNPIWLSGGLMAVLSYSLGLSKNVLTNNYFFYFSLFFWHSKTRIIVRKFDRMRNWYGNIFPLCVWLYNVTLARSFLSDCAASKSVHFYLEILCKSVLNCWNYLSICISIKLLICIDFVQDEGFCSNFPRIKGSINSSRLWESTYFN